MPLISVQTPFEGPRAKLEWATQHINDLAAICDDFFAEHYRLVLIDYTPLYPYIRVRGVQTKNKKPLPNDMPLTLGDAIHNLRSALDLLAFHILKDLGRAEEDIYFPIVRHKTGPIAAKNTIQSAGVHLAGSDVLALFESFEPYRGGHLKLWELHALDIIDKHRLLLTTAQFIQVSRLIFKELDPWAPNWHITGSSIGAMSVDWPSWPPLPSWTWFPTIPHKERDLGMTSTIFFKDGPFDGEPVLPTLHTLADNVRSVIESTEALFT